MGRQELFLNCLSSKLFTYALGREMGLADQPMIKRAVDDVKAGDMTLRRLIKAVVESEAFGTK
jgi:hypothetical protein